MAFFVLLPQSQQQKIVKTAEDSEGQDFQLVL
jgi:hypothetical protein